MKCCICGKEIDGYGNNPYGALGVDCKPINWSPEDECCDSCNLACVIPGRLLLVQQNKGFTKR